MLIMGILAAAGVAASVVGTAMQIRGNRIQTQGLQDAELNRRRQQALESARMRRQVVRESLKARALAQSTAFGQGAGRGSGAQGGYAQIAGQANRGILGINQNDQIGSNIFAANATAGRGASMANTGAGLSSLGGTIINNLPTFGRIATFVQNRP